MKTACLSNIHTNVTNTTQTLPWAGADSCATRGRAAVGVCWDDGAGGGIELLDWRLTGCAAEAGGATSITTEPVPGMAAARILSVTCLSGRCQLCLRGALSSTSSRWLGWRGCPVRHYSSNDAYQLARRSRGIGLKSRLLAIKIRLFHQMQT